MYSVFVLSVLCCLGVCYGTTTTTDTTTTTTPPPPFNCYSYTCYERGCLARDITNSTNYPSWNITTCMTGGSEYCAIHISSNDEVRATCETTCTTSGNTESSTATWCCQTELCNDNENRLPVPNGAPHLVGKTMALLLTAASVFVLHFV